VGATLAALTVAPKLVRKRFHGLSPEQARKLLDATQGDRLEAVFTVALSLGLRMGEILGLRWQDLDPANAMLTVNQAMYRLTGKGMVARLVN
jgi:integrase